MGTFEELPSSVQAVSSLRLSGNMIPDNWYKAITRSQNKPDLQAIVILADIIYWYRCREIRDEKSGLITGYEKKFNSDMLQKSYGQLEKKFGLSKRQVKRAVDRLVECGLIRIEFRTVLKDDSTPHSNVLFIEPIAEEIYEITYNITNKNRLEKDADKCKDVTKNGNTLLPKLVTPSYQKRQDPPTKIGKTYTETTTETTTKINNLDESGNPDCLVEKDTNKCSKEDKQNLLGNVNNNKEKETCTKGEKLKKALSSYDEYRKYMELEDFKKKPKTEWVARDFLRHYFCGIAWKEGGPTRFPQWNKDGKIMQRLIEKYGHENLHKVIVTLVKDKEKIEELIGREIELNMEILSIGWIMSKVEKLAFNIQSKSSRPKSTIEAVRREKEAERLAIEYRDSLKKESLQND